MITVSMLKQFLERRLGAAFIYCVIGIALPFCVDAQETRIEGEAATDSTLTKFFTNGTEITLVQPSFNAVVALEPKARREYKSPKERNWDEGYDPSSVKHGQSECSKPTPVVFEWKISGEPSVCFTLQVSNDESFENCREFVCGTNCSCEATNFNLETTYYWRVKVDSCSGNVESDKVLTNFSSVSRFTTNSVWPCWFDVPGISNVRDIGGWRAAGGKRVKTGVIYRGTEFDAHFDLSEEGKRILLEDLGLRTDFDLRGPSEWGNAPDYRSPLGSDFPRLNFPLSSYGSIFSDAQKELYRETFRALADKSIYPIYIHCWGGADRAGTLVMAIKSVLGVSDDDIFVDYELTSLSVNVERSVHSNDFKALLKELKAYGGENDTFASKFVNYLLSVGVTQEELDSIRETLLENVD